MKDLDEGRLWCEEAWALLGARKTKKLEQAPSSESTTPLPEAEPEGVDAKALLRAETAAKLGLTFRQRFSKTDPPGAAKAQIERLRLLRRGFTDVFVDNPDKPTLKLIEQTFDAVVIATSEIIDDLALRKKLQTQLEQLVPAGSSGSAMVPGATDADTAALQALRDKTGTALDNAFERDALMALHADLAEIGRAREAVQSRVEARIQRAAQLTLDAAAIKTPDEALPGALDSERADVAGPLQTQPLSDDALAAAAAALLRLGSAWQGVEAEAAALRQMRALFKAEADALAKRLAALGEGLSKAQKNKLPPIEKEIAAALAVLKTAASRADTARFPALLKKAKESVMLLVGSVVGGNNDAGKAAASYLVEELKDLARQARELPNRDEESDALAKQAQNQLLAARAKLGAGTGGQASQARPLVVALADTIDEWRHSAGAAGIVLGQRRSLVQQAIDRPDPTGCSEAFKKELKALRDRVSLSQALPLHEDSVSAAEAGAKPMDDLLARAGADAAAASRVATARLTLTAQLAGAIAAARPAAAIELGKLQAQADARALLTETNRDMPRTAALHDALLLRMQQIQAEPAYADADPASLAALDEGVRELAFELCGPTLLKSMKADAKKALGALLHSDGPALRQLAEQAFGGNPQVFAQVLGDCGASGLATLARALDGEPNAAGRVALEGLIEKGGLADQPAILSRLLGAGPKDGDSAEDQLAAQQRLERHCTALKSMAENFGGAEGQLAMSTLLGDCGLGSSPELLPALLQQHGLDGDGAELRAFAQAFVGPERTTERAGLARIVGSGGIGEHPNAFAPLVKRGGAAAVKQIAAAFVDPADCANLKGLLKNGGMGGDTSSQARQHEHPDTLSKVFTDGLGGSGEHLKTFAKAFSGPAKQQDCKAMLDAFNAYGDDDALQRQPGQAIGRLLDGSHLQGSMAQRIQKLSTQFMPNIKRIGAGEQREQAIRMAPHFGTQTAQESWKPTSPAMTGANIKKVTASVLKRHQPECFDRSKMKLNTPQSMFPPGCNVGDLLDQALRKVSADRSRAQTVTVTAGPPPTTITVEIGFLAGDTVNHFGPRGSVATPHPQETPIFENDEINAIYDAIF